MHGIGSGVIYVYIHVRMYTANRVSVREMDYLLACRSLIFGRIIAFIRGHWEKLLSLALPIVWPPLFAAKPREHVQRDDFTSLLHLRVLRVTSRESNFVVLKKLLG